MPLGAARFGLGGGVIDLGQLELITSTSADGTTNGITFTNIKEDEYAVHLLVGTELTNVGGNSHMNLRLSTDGGSSFDTSSNYDKAAQYGNSANTDKGNSRYQNDTDFEYFFTTDNSSTTATAGSYAFLYNLGNTRYSSYTCMTSGNNGNNSTLYYVYQSGMLSVSSVHNAFKIFASTTSHEVKGKFQLYGIRGVPT